LLEDKSCINVHVVEKVESACFYHDISGSAYILKARLAPIFGYAPLFGYALGATRKS